MATTTQDINKSYLPEWKVYLWKKLLLDKNSSEKIFQPSDFVYFTDDEQKGAMIRQNQKVIDMVNNAYHEAYNSVLVGKKSKIDTSGDIPISDQYYYFEPKTIMFALIELAGEELKCLEITDIELRKDILYKYRQKRKDYLLSYERKHLAGISGYTHGSSVPKYEPDNRFTDPFCDLPENIYKKVENAEKLTLSELAELVNSTIDESIYLLFYFKINIYKGKLQSHLDKYVENFITGKLIPPQGVRYFKFDQQKNKILGAIQSLANQYGNNMRTSYEEIAKHGGWEGEEERHYRFYEVLFALEKTGEIEIKDLEKDEVIVSLLEKYEIPKKELSSADKKKLFILEKLKEEWDLTPKESVSTHVSFGYYYHNPAGEKDISSQTFSSWQNECGIDFLQLKSILDILQSEGLINSFEFMSEFR